MPSIWFVNGLHCATVDDACPFDVAGVSFPGVPGVVLGHNARIAWGATNADPDVQDLVIETVDPADPSRYLGPGGVSLPFTVRTEQIAVSGGTPVSIEVRETVHGPILNDVDQRLIDSPLLAAPFIWLFGTNGFLVFHALLMTACFLCAYSFLCARSHPVSALIFAFAFLFVSIVPIWFAQKLSGDTEALR